VINYVFRFIDGLRQADRDRVLAPGHTGPASPMAQSNGATGPSARAAFAESVVQ
jgi:hypothetical protein